MTDTSLKTFLCSRCYAARYCSKQCQREAWAQHRTETCDLVVSWVKALIKQGYRYLGSCTDEEVLAAQQHYPKCENLVFETFCRVTTPANEVVTARYHRHRSPADPCLEEKATRCNVTYGDTVTTAIPSAPPGS